MQSALPRLRSEQVFDDKMGIMTCEVPVNVEASEGADGVLRVKVIRIPEDHPTASRSLLDLLPGGVESQHSQSVWAGHSRQMIGWGEAFRLNVQGENAIRSAARLWDEVCGDAEVLCMCEQTCKASQMPALPVAFASFGFSRGAQGFMTVPEVALIELPAGDFGAQKWGFPWGGWGRARGDRFLATAAWVQEADSEAVRPSSAVESPADPWEVLASLEGVAGVPTDAFEGVEFETLPGRMTQQQWTEQVGLVIEALNQGAAQKVVMSRDMIVRSSEPLDQSALVQRLTELYPTTWVYAVGGLVGATPEMLAAMSDQTVLSRVLAGTIGPGQGDELMGSMKDRTEHMFAVESVARALGPICTALNVPEAPMILDLPNVTHLATDVSAVLDGRNIVDVVAALHPTAAVCGTPTSHAYDLLDQYEDTQRGRYSAPVGWVDGAGEGEFGIALRCGQMTEDSLSIRLFAGGGIMPDSVPEKELAETRAKMAPVLQALGLV